MMMRCKGRFLGICLIGMRVGYHHAVGQLVVMNVGGELETRPDKEGCQQNSTCMSCKIVHYKYSVRDKNRFCYLNNNMI